MNINEFIEHIPNDIIKFYDDNLKSSLAVSFTEYISSMDISLEEYFENYTSIFKTTRNILSTTKLNWYKRAVSDLNTRKETSYLYALYCNQVEEYNRTNNTWTLFYNTCMNQLTSFRNSGKSLIYYPFIELLTYRTKENILKKMIIMELCLFVDQKKNSPPSILNKKTILQPIDFSYGPIFSVLSSSVKKLSEKMTVENKDELVGEIYFDDYKFTDEGEEYTLRNYVIATDEQYQVEHNFSTLSSFDVKVLSYVVNAVQNDYNSFLNTRMYRGYLSDIVKAVYPNFKGGGIKYYNNVKQSLMKLSVLYIEGLKDNKSFFRINYFSMLKVDSDDDKPIVTLSFGNELYNNIQKQRIQHVYAHEVSKLAETSSQLLYYLMESQRQRVYAAGKIYENHIFNYNFFIKSIRFPGRYSKNTIMQFLYDIFQDFKQKNIIIESINLLREGFSIKFISYTKEDAEKLNLKSFSSLSEFNF